MDDVLFRNEFVRDRSCAREVFAYYVFWRTVDKLMYGFYAFCFVISLVCGLIVGDLRSVMVIVGAVLFLGLTMLLNYRVQVKTLLARDLEMSGGGEMRVTTEITKGEVRISACGNETAIPHDAIKSAFRTKNYVVIITRAKFMYIFKNDSFSVGDAEGLWVFLKKKRIKFV